MSENVEIVKDNLDGWENACLVKKGDNYFIASSISTAFDTGQPETLVFPANAEGDVTSWLDVAGGRNVGRNEALAELARLEETEE